MRQITDRIEVRRLQSLFQPCAKLFVPIHELLERHGVATSPDVNPTRDKPLIFEYGVRELFALSVSEQNPDHTIVQSLKYAEDSDRVFDILRQFDRRKAEEIGPIVKETWGPDYESDAALYLR